MKKHLVRTGRAIAGLLSLPYYFVAGMSSIITIGVIGLVTDITADETEEMMDDCIDMFESMSYKIAGVEK